jgi:hypothetical protein
LTLETSQMFPPTFSCFSQLKDFFIFTPFGKFKNPVSRDFSLQTLTIR